MKLFNIETDEKWSKKLSGTVIPHLRNDYLYEFVKEHIKKIDELSPEEQEDILRQQKEWDKYLNN